MIILFRKIKHISINVGLILVSVSIVIVLCEIILRMTPYKMILEEFLIKNYHKSDVKAGFDISENFPRHLRQFENMSYYVWSNELGCFDEPYDGKEEYILLVGDSFTYDFAPFENLWGTKIEKLINYRVVKCGVGGYGTRQEYFKAVKIIEKIMKPPKLIIVGYYIGNDLEDDYCFPNSTVMGGYPVTKKAIADYNSGEIKIYNDEDMKIKVYLYEKYGTFEQGKYPRLLRLKHWIKKKSIVFNLCKNFIKVTIQKMPLGMKPYLNDKFEIIKSRSSIQISFMDWENHIWVKEAWNEHLGNIRKFKELSEEIGSKLLIVLIPTKEQVYPTLKEENIGSKVNMKLPNNQIANYLKKEGILYLDLLPYFDLAGRKGRIGNLGSYRELYNKMDFHFNIDGHNLAALIVSQKIVKEKIFSIKEDGEKMSYIREALRNYE